MIDVKRLFREVEVQAEFDDELQAVVDNRKPMLFESFPLASLMEEWSDDVERGPDSIANWIGTALDQGCMVVMSPATRIEARNYLGINAFITKLDHLWRIPVFLEQYECLSRWNPLLEARSSRLLGYSEPAIARWLEFLDQISVGFGLATIHFIATNEQRAAVEASGMRRVPSSSNPPMTLVLVPSGHAPKPDLIDELVGRSMGRVGVPHRSVDLLLGDRAVRRAVDEGGVVRELTPELLDTFNAQMATNIQFWDGERWQR